MVRTVLFPKKLQRLKQLVNASTTFPADYLDAGTATSNIWDYIGVWQYGKNQETIAISKSIAGSNLSIQYNASSDDYEDRYFENATFKDGKIYGDFYGGT